MGAEEEVVREAWESVNIPPLSPAGRMYIGLGVVLLANDHGEGYKSEQEAWTAAAEFTRRHRQKIAEVEEEIAWLEDCPCLGNEAEQQRVLKARQEALADLRRGWKGKP